MNEKPSLPDDRAFVIRHIRVRVFPYATSAGLIADAWRAQLRIEPLTRPEFAPKEPPVTSPPLAVE